MSQQYDSVLEETKAAREQASSRDAEISALRTAVQTQAEQLERIQAELNDSEQYSRNMNMETHGLKEADENLKEVLSDIAGKLEVRNFSLSEVESVHRLPGRRDAIPRVLERFTSIASREKLYEVRTKLQNLSEPGKRQTIFFNDNLRRLNRDLFWRARTMAKQNEYKFARVKRGKIYVKKTENSSLLRITRPADLDQILN